MTEQEYKLLRSKRISEDAADSSCVLEKFETDHEILSFIAFQFVELIEAIRVLNDTLNDISNKMIL